MKDQQIKWTPALMGEKGGKKKSDKKTDACRKNGKLGGAPRGKRKTK